MDDRIGVPMAVHQVVHLLGRRHIQLLEDMIADVLLEPVEVVPGAAPRQVVDTDRVHARYVRHSLNECRSDEAGRSGDDDLHDRSASRRPARAMTS